VEPLVTDIAVVGAGPAGLTAALACAAAGVSVALVGRPAADARTTALLATSITALERLGVWADCRAQAAPLRVMRIVDDTRRLWRAPEARFSSEEIGLDAFGWNIENTHLAAALAARIAATPAIAGFAVDATGITSGADGAAVALADGRVIAARLVVGADGRRSLVRSAAGIETDGRSYPQTAMGFTLRHSRPHHDISTEFHTEHGPFTLVPLPGSRSSLVWVTHPAEAEDIAGRDDAALAKAIERRSHSILGAMTLEPPRGRFPLAVETARRFSAERTVLVGEAAHTLPPIGAQGFNLGLRDIATVAELVADARRSGADIGGPAVTDAYDRQRRADTAARRIAIDWLNRSLLSDFLPVQGARGLGLYLIDRIGPLRRAAMREGVSPLASSPRLMRGEPL